MRNESITVRPSEAAIYTLLLTCQSHISHHDPSVTDGSNRVLFNRSKKKLDASYRLGRPVAESDLLPITQGWPVPAELVDLFTDVPFAQFVGTCMLKTFIDIYNPRNAGDGEGVYSGIDRYGRLEDRVRQAAIKTKSLSAFWAALTQSLGVGIHETRWDSSLVHLWLQPPAVQILALQSLATDPRSGVVMARLWAAQVREGRKPIDQQSPKGDLPLTPSGELQELHFDLAGIPEASMSTQTVEIPSVSANSLRHQMLREPGRNHLFHALGITPGGPGRGVLPIGVEGIFYNGGNIAPGASAPDSPHGISWDVRDQYPLLDLVGGCLDGFMLGESQAAIAAWVACRENADVLGGYHLGDSVNLEASVFDLLDDVTLTRHEGSLGVGQMIASAEMMVPGSQVVVRIHLKPWTKPITHGALLASLNNFEATIPTIGGADARGHGFVSVKRLSGPEDAEEGLAIYESHLVDHREKLRRGLIDGTFCTDKVLCKRG